MFIAWSTSETFTGNVTFIYDQPLTVTALSNYIFNNGFQGADAELAATGFQGNSGFGCTEPPPYDFLDFADCPYAGGTGWFTALGSAQPLETFTLTFTIFDKSDTILDTLALVDNWRWDCMGCVPSEVNSCGIRPQ